MSSWRGCALALPASWLILAGPSMAAETAGTPTAPVLVAPNMQTDDIDTSAGRLEIRPLFHGSVMLRFNGQVIYIDPFSRADFSGLPPADLIVITHTHVDHLDRALVEKLHQPATLIVGPPAVIDTLNCAPACGNPQEIADDAQKTVMGIRIEGVPMYNLVRGPVPGKPWHHRGVGSGYVLNFGTTRVYVSGDSECTPEMKALNRISVAFLAMNPPRTSSPTEVAACARAFRPGIVYPYHYAGSDPREFAAAVASAPGIEVRLRKLEGEP